MTEIPSDLMCQKMHEGLNKVNPDDRLNLLGKTRTLVEEYTQVKETVGELLEETRHLKALLKLYL